MQASYRFLAEVGARRRSPILAKIERLRRSDQRGGMPDQLQHEAFSDIEFALVFGQVALPVRLVEQQPLAGFQPSVCSRH